MAQIMTTAGWIAVAVIATIALAVLVIIVVGVCIVPRCCSRCRRCREDRRRRKRREGGMDRHTRLDDLTEANRESFTDHVPIAHAEEEEEVTQEDV